MAAAENRILESLREAERPLSWDEIENRINFSGDEIEDAIMALSDKRLVEHRPTKADYKLSEWPDEDTCAICGKEIEAGTHYRIRIEERGVEDPERRSATVHETCALQGLPKGLY